MPTPDRTSYAEIVAAARSILEERGPDGLTMQAVADRVGVRAPSLYKRVTDRDALVGAAIGSMIDELADRLERGDRDLAGLIETYRAYAHEHPAGFRMMFGDAAPRAALDRCVAPVMRAAEDLLGEADALNAARLLTAWATGFLQMELAGAFRMGDVDEAFRYGLRRLVSALAS